MTPYTLIFQVPGNSPSEPPRVAHTTYTPEVAAHIAKHHRYTDSYNYIIKPCNMALVLTSQLRPFLVVPAWSYARTHLPLHLPLPPTLPQANLAILDLNNFPEIFL